MNTPIRPQDHPYRPAPSSLDALDRSATAAGWAGTAGLAPSWTERGDAAHVERLGDELTGTIARDPTGFGDAMAAAFGDKADLQSVNALIDAAMAGRLAVPPVRIVEPGALGDGARGAYAASGGPGGGPLIVLDRTLLADEARLTRVFTEEYGHHLDAALGGPDSAGDEGEVFAAALLGGADGQALPPSAFARMAAEHDRGTVLLDGRVTAVEFYAAPSPVGGSPNPGTQQSGQGSTSDADGTGGSSGAGNTAEDEADEAGRETSAGGTTGGASQTDGADETDEADETEDDDEEDDEDEDDTSTNGTTGGGGPGPVTEAPAETTGGFDASLGGAIDGGAPGAPGGARDEYVSADGGGSGGAGTTGGGGGLNDDTAEDNVGDGGPVTTGGSTGGGTTGGFDPTLGGTLDAGLSDTDAEEEEGGRTEYVTLDGSGSGPDAGVVAVSGGANGGDEPEPLGPVHEPPPTLDGNPFEGVLDFTPDGAQATPPWQTPQQAADGVARPVPGPEDIAELPVTSAVAFPVGPGVGRAVARAVARLVELVQGPRPQPSTEPAGANGGGQRPPTPPPVSVPPSPPTSLPPASAGPAAGPAPDASPSETDDGPAPSPTDSGAPAAGGSMPPAPVPDGADGGDGSGGGGIASEANPLGTSTQPPVGPAPLAEGPEPGAASPAAQPSEGLEPGVPTANGAGGGGPATGAQADSNGAAGMEAHPNEAESLANPGDATGTAGAPGVPPSVPTPGAGQPTSTASGSDAADRPSGPNSTTSPAPVPPDPDDLYIDRSNSAKLRANLDAEYARTRNRAAGIPIDPVTDQPLDGYEAHHIVPAEVRGENISKIRDLLQQLGLDIDGAANGIYLPKSPSQANNPEGRTWHNHTQRASYDVYLGRKFQNELTAGERIGDMDEAELDELRGNFLDQLEEVQGELLNNVPRLPRSDGSMKTFDEDNPLSESRSGHGSDADTDRVIGNPTSESVF